MGNKQDMAQTTVDAILRLAAAGTFISAALLLPNLPQALEKPLDAAMKKLDKRSREREIRKALYYMKEQNLLRGSYEHGLKITKKGRSRLEKKDIERLRIPRPAKWDKKWRIIFYDIPETSKYHRNLLAAKLNGLGFYQLQRSVWVHPFPCRDEIEKVTSFYKVSSHVTYLETEKIDNQKKLISRFKKLL